MHDTSVDLATNELWITIITLSKGLVNTNTLAQLLTLVAPHAQPVDTFVTHTFTFDQILDAYDVVGHAAQHDAFTVLIQ